MSRIFKNLVPYWRNCLLIILFLILQAFCDLALPQYTSDIIDNGIQNGGIEHIFPEKITKSEHELATLFMTDDQIDIWNKSYSEDGDVYTLNVSNEKDLKKYDKDFSFALIMDKQFSMVEQSRVDEYMNQMNQNMQMPGDGVNQQMMQSGQMNMPQPSFYTVDSEDENGNIVSKTYADLRPMFKAMLDSKLMTKQSLIELRDKMAESYSAAGEALTTSMGITYTKSREAQAGIDADKKQTNYLLISGAKMVGVALLLGLCTVVVGFLAAKVGAGIGRDLRKKVYSNVMKFSNAEMDKFSTASLITRSTNDVQQIQMVTTLMLRMVAYAPILGIGGIIKVVNTGAGMGWIILLAVLVIIALIMLLIVIAMPKFKQMQKLVDGLNLVAREILTGIPVIRAFGRENKEEQRFDAANRKLTNNMLFTNRVMTFMMPAMTIVMNGLSVLIVWVGANKINEGSLQVGALTAFITYAMQIVMSFLMLTMLSIVLPRAGVAADRIDEVIKTKSTIEDPINPEEIGIEKGVVEFKHVSFKYPGANENAIEDISFIAKPGETTAIIGSTGCGKSTLINLIPRLYDATEGTVTIDGHDVRNITLHELRDELGYVPQKGILFSGTISSNLRFGCADASQEQIEKAADIAQAREFIDAKKTGFETSISEGGTNVSGGQKQRLSIARAIAKNPKVYIFDDSFSALDLKTDAKLRKALSEEVSDSTVIIVAQRISTVLHAEQILVMEDGKIVGKGTHEQLLKTCEVYRQIAISQLSAKELEKSSHHNVVNGTSDSTADNTTNSISDSTSDNTTDNTSDSTSDNTTDSTSDSTSDNTTGSTSDDAIGNVSGKEEA